MAIREFLSYPRQFLAQKNALDANAEGEIQFQGTGRDIINILQCSIGCKESIARRIGDVPVLLMTQVLAQFGFKDSVYHQLGEMLQ